jgi:hypothetical protein
MMKRLIVTLTVAGLLLIVSGPILAHHGQADHDTSKNVTVKGTMTDFKFINPHCLLFFDVTNDKGETEKWEGQLTSPNKLAHVGWTKYSLKPGDAVTVGGYPSKSGSHTIWIRSLIGPDGKSFSVSENQD